MKFSFFYHSLMSDWNHGNAHFLRGVVSELMSRGHEVWVFEPAGGWSRNNLLRDHGAQALADFQQHYPGMHSYVYERETLDLERVTGDSDVVIVHEWNEPWLVNGLGQQRKNGGKFRLLFHDTHHRVVSDPAWLKRFKLEYYDGVLAFGDVISEGYRAYGWSDAIWTWHEAADTRVFYPRPADPDLRGGDVVWIGNWGDDERNRELEDFLFRPVRELGLSCDIYGVRYPQEVLEQMARQNVDYLGWLANFRVPEVFAQHKVTIHVPRRYYQDCLPGIPTIRPFEAMACGIPLISAPWEDSEHLFTPGKDYLLARDTEEMKEHLQALLESPDYAREIADHGLATIREQHSCAQRVDQLLDIIAQLGLPENRGDWAGNAHSSHRGRQHHART